MNEPPGDQADPEWHWWRERRSPAERLHLDSAAAGRSSAATLAATAAHAEREAATGAYVAAAEAAPVLARGRAELAHLLGVPPAGLAFVPNASAALTALLAVWPFRDGDTVAVVPSEWGPNLHAFGRRGLRVTALATCGDARVDPAAPATRGDGRVDLAAPAACGDGRVDLAALERTLAQPPDRRPALVHLTQVASHRGLVQPVAEAAALCRAAEVPLWVDAAQALGHVEVAGDADAIYATSRKWLTGPRGVGVAGVAERWWDRLRVSVPDMVAEQQPAGSSPLWLVEWGEANVAAWIGLCTAVTEFVQAGPARVWARLDQVGRLTREALADLPGWALVDPVAAGSAITALRARNGQDVPATRNRLLDEHGIVTTVSAVTRAPRELTAPLLRISPHVDCTAADLDRLHRALLALG